MLSMISEVSWLGVAAATVASFVLGGLWFTALFGKAYSAALGREHDPAAKPGMIFILGPLVWSFITALTSAVLMAALGIETIGQALGFGLFVGFGYLAATTVNTGINPNIPNHGAYGLINGAYHLLAGTIITVVLVLL